MQRNTHALREQRTLRPARRDDTALPAASLEELAAAIVVGPDDGPLEIEDLAAHFLFEATESGMPSSLPPSASPVFARGADAEMREAFFDEVDDRERLREFERVWKHILSRELAATEL